jgi:hypothetical protein
MVAGDIDLQLFGPSSHFAFAKDVSYKLQFKVPSGIKVGWRMVIQMPQTLNFNGACSFDGLGGNCAIDANNLITITDMVTSDLAKNSLIKLVIKTASNPEGAREAGPYSV